MKTKLTGEVFQTFQNVGTIEIKIIKEVLVDGNLELQYQRVFKVSRSFVILWYDEWPSLEEVVLLVESSRIGAPYVQYVLFGNTVFSMDFC